MLSPRHEPKQTELASATDTVCAVDSAAYLDCLTALETRVGYGQLGLQGDLGYEGKPVVVQGKRYLHAPSTHPPARLLFHLGGRFSSFRCPVALNDDVPGDLASGPYCILAAEGLSVRPSTITASAPQKHKTSTADSLPS